MAIIPCDDCGKPIDISGMSKRKDGEKFVCGSCNKRYKNMENMIKLMEQQSGTVH